MSRESYIEKKVCEYARSKGYLTPKLNVVGERGWPDRMFIHHEFVGFVEFKAPGKEVSPIQEFRITQLLHRKFVVAIIDDVAKGKQIVDFMESTRLPEKSN